MAEETQPELLAVAERRGLPGVEAHQPGQVHFRRAGDRLLERRAKCLQALDAAADRQEAPSRVARHAVQRIAGERGERSNGEIELAQQIGEARLAPAALGEAL